MSNRSMPWKGKVATDLFAFSLCQKAILLRLLLFTLVAYEAAKDLPKCLVNVYSSALRTSRILLRIQRHSYIIQTPSAFYNKAPSPKKVKNGAW